MIEIKSLRTVSDFSAVIDTVIAHRKKYKMTQKDLADAVGISQPYMSKIEKGYSQDVPFDLILKLISVFDINILLGKVVINEKGE